MRIKCEKLPLCYDFSGADAFLNNAANKQKLGAKGEWASCNFIVNKMFMGDWMHNFHQLIPDMLHDGIDVTVYAGDVDYICNWLGNKRWTLALDWAGKQAFNAAPDAPFGKDGKAGRVR